MRTARSPNSSVTQTVIRKALWHDVVVTHLPAPSAAAWTLCVAMLSRVPRNCMAKRVLPDQSSELAKSIGPLL
jgi:hypothetical protein